jgi:DNA-directed RNA polymerase subunit beta'
MGNLLRSLHRIWYWAAIILTIEKKAEKDENGNVINGVIGEGKIFANSEEAVMAYQNGYVSLHARIKVRVVKTIDGVKRSKLVDTTVGKIIFNSAVPQNLGFVDRTDPETMFDLKSISGGKNGLAKLLIDA